MSSRADSSPRSGLKALTRDERGSVVVEAIGCFVVLMALVVSTLFVFDIAQVGLSGSTDNRTAARNAALNNSCSRSGIIPAQPGTIGTRENSVIAITCDTDVNGESGLEEDDRFWADLTAQSNTHWRGYNERQSDHMQFNAVYAQQRTLFHPDINIAQSGVPIFYTNSALIPGNETWRFDETHWAEGHDVVTWNALTSRHQEMFPHVYPSANPRPPSSRSRSLRELDKVIAGQAECGDYFKGLTEGDSLGDSSVTANPYEAGNDADPDNRGVGAETTLFDVKKSLKPPKQEGSIEGDYEYCRSDITGQFRSSMTVSFDWSKNFLGFGIDSKTSFTGKRYDQKRTNRKTGAIREISIVIGEVEVDLEAKAGSSKEAKAAIGATGVRGSMKYCPAFNPSICAGVELNFLKAGIDTKKRDLDAALGSVVFSGEGTFTIRGVEVTLKGEVEIAVMPFSIDTEIGLDTDTKEALLEIARRIYEDPYDET